MHASAPDLNSPTKPGDTVVAVVDGKATVKSLGREGDQYVLRCESPAHEFIRPDESLEMPGRRPRPVSTHAEVTR
ncbi:MAG TPA: S24 family peptidase [Accumulibacter sp.]|nr:S24 family peptidase [Accumulibacter sp.]